MTDDPLTPFDMLREIHLNNDDGDDGYTRWLLEKYAELGIVVTHNGVRQPAPRSGD